MKNPNGGNTLKNKKILITVFTLLALLFLVGPYFMGKLAKDKMDQDLVTLSKMPGYALKINSYEQGWFTSKAVISYGFDQHTIDILTKNQEFEKEDQALKDLVEQGLIFDITLAHGPVTFQNGLKFGLFSFEGNLQYAELVKFLKITENIPLLSLQAHISYFGNMSVALTGHPFEVKDDPAIDSAKFKGLQFSVEINKDISHYELDGVLEGFEIISPKVTMTMNEISLQSTSDRLNDFLWTGKGVSNIDDIIVSNGDNNLFTLKDLTSHYSIEKQDEKNVKVSMDLNIGQLFLQKLNITEMSTDIKISNIGIQALTDYINAAYGNDPREITLAGIKLTQNSPEMILEKLSFKIGEGYFDSKGKLSIKGAEDITLEQFPVYAKQNFMADIQISFNKTLGEQITLFSLRQQLNGIKDPAALPTEEQLLQMAQMQTSLALQSSVQQGMLTQDEAKYSAHIEMKEGKTLVNGKDMPVPGL